MGGRFLVKTGASLPAAIGGSALGLAGFSFTAEKLFDVAGAGGGPLAASGAGGGASWYLLRTTEPFAAAGAGAEWDMAHRLLREMSSGLALGPGTGLLAIEPDLEQSWLPPGEAAVAMGVAGCVPDPQDSDGVPTKSPPTWHLGPDFSDLKAARELVGEQQGRQVAIAHLDTGYDPRHIALPVNIDLANQRNFVEPDRPRDATDRSPGGLFSHPGHGIGTLGILAGNRLTGAQPPQVATGDFLGGAPFARVVPMRIANSVVQLWTSSVALAIDEARRLGVDVISMSMGGLPSQAWADAVNAAYEAGIVIVCAAGNNKANVPTPNLVWPARFDRVIAACGAMADRRPYHNLRPWVMQGNVGPASRMASAVAAFTPNIPWARITCRNVFDLNGRGTSAATPQVAASAALWLARHGGGLARDWRRVELARKALFTSATRTVPGMSPGDIAAYYGNGIVQARAALDRTPALLGAVQQTPPDSASFAFLRALTGFGMAGSAGTDLLALEMTQLASTNAGFRRAIEDPEAVAGPAADDRARQAAAILIEDSRCSTRLRRHLEGMLGQGPSVPGTRLPPAATAASVPKEAGEAQAVLGSQLPRRLRALPPPHRKLRIFGLDPSFSNRLDTSAINEVTVQVPWETDARGRDSLQPGPVGEYLEVVDIDPQSNCAYAPVDLDHPHVLARNGLDPSTGNPRFHQQMVYAVAMKTIGHFEHALGRTALWAPRSHAARPTGRRPPDDWDFVRRLRIYPHALMQENAFYSPAKVALLFGYFPQRSAADRPGGLVFTCLSHDIVAHETAHALLDGLHRRFREPSNKDTLAFHEAFSDIIAIFQHFTYPEILRHEIGRTRGRLDLAELLAGLAHQFGTALGYSRALRSAIGQRPVDLDTVTKPHERGAILVATIFRAFVSIYRRQVADLIRIATGGSGQLPAGALHPDLVNRLADEAAKIAGRVLAICIRALDYCPPVDITFPDYLRALITADSDLVPDDDHAYRLAFLEAFEAYRIFPTGIRTISVESLRWRGPDRQIPGFAGFLATLDLSWSRRTDRRNAHMLAKRNGRAMHDWLTRQLRDDPGLAALIGVSVAPGARFEVHSVRPARRVAPDGSILTDVIAVLTQSRNEPYDRKHPERGSFRFRSGATLVLDAHNADAPIRYAVVKRSDSPNRAKTEGAFRLDRLDASGHAMYFGEDNEPFAACHAGH